MDTVKINGAYWKNNELYYDLDYWKKYIQTGIDNIDFIKEDFLRNPRDKPARICIVTNLFEAKNYSELHEMVISMIRNGVDDIIGHIGSIFNNYKYISIVERVDDSTKFMEYIAILSNNKKERLMYNYYMHIVKNMELSRIYKDYWA